MLFPEDRMNVHKNARLTPHGRERIVRRVLSGQIAARILFRCIIFGGVRERRW